MHLVIEWSDSLIVEVSWSEVRGDRRVDEEEAQDTMIRGHRLRGCGIFTTKFTLAASSGTGSPSLRTRQRADGYHATIQKPNG